MVKRLHSVLFYASDLAATADFYERCGLSVVRSDDDPVIRITMGDFTLEFLSEQKATIKNKASNVPKGLGIYTYVEVDDADAHFAEIKRNGVEPSTEPKTWPWGKREFVVKDPDGFRIVFYSPVKK